MLVSLCLLAQTYFWDYTEKHTEWPTVRTAINQEERRRDKMPADTTNVQSLTDGISQLAISGWHNTSMIFVDDGFKASEVY